MSELPKRIGETPSAWRNAFKFGGEVACISYCEKQQHDKEEDIAQHAGQPAEQAARDAHQPARADLIREILQLLRAYPDRLQQLSGLL